MAGEQNARIERGTWNGTFQPESYATARRILESDWQRALGEMKREVNRRGRIVGIIAIVWAACSVAMAVANPELMLVAEIGWVVIVAWAVFWMFPALTGRANIDDVYGHYAAQLDELETARTPIPEPSCIEDLVAAINALAG